VWIVAYFIAVCFKEMVSAPWRWQDNSAETHKNCVKDCTHKLQNSVFGGVK
jgi:hypothetical protein